MKFYKIPVSYALFGVAALIALSGAFAGGLYLGAYHTQELPPVLGLAHTDNIGGAVITPDDPGQTVDFANFWKAWQILQTQFTPSGSSTSTPTDQAKVSAAIAGMVGSYNDPYTVFLPKAQADHLKESVRGTFEGIGAVMSSLNDGSVMITDVFPGSPAEKAGLIPGMRVTAVDGTPVLGRSLTEVVSGVRGASGTAVKLTIIGLNKASAVISVTRGTVNIPTVASAVVSRVTSVAKAAVKAVESVPAMISGTQGAAVGDAGATNPTSTSSSPAAPVSNPVATAKPVPPPTTDYRVIQLAIFASSSKDEFKNELEAFVKSANEHNLIIDLRNNPGGELDVAIDLASYFVPKGQPIVSEKVGTNPTPQVQTSAGYDLLQGRARCVAVLINGQSASASEIFAGALQDNHVAHIVGTQSYGKGSVQQLVDLGDIGSLKITIARWFTPSGTSISLKGVTPDVVVDPTKYPNSNDPYIDAAIATCKNAK